MRERRTSTPSGHDELTTRRTSLLALGGAALATLASRAPKTEAKKNKNTSRKDRKRCQKQGPPCQEFATRLCARFLAPSPIRDACENRANGCCTSIEDCQGGGYFDCLFEHIDDLVPV